MTIYTQSYTRAYTRTRTRIFRPQFLDSAVIFRRQFLDIIVIFRTQTAIFRLQKHKFSIKSKILFGYSKIVTTFAVENNKYTKQ